ncbi:Peroxisomal membrane PEX30 [Lecanosticta acicola]|uniref:Peroxisomal membrane PEX30 n=1 Tax=Lecanosticta acicola TaxID=111012 RepID=A0AAI8YVG4_9PEZI|nr:Peroxisomal membrane PEX30 [Lecanosticta acicola]
MNERDSQQSSNDGPGPVAPEPTIAAFCPNQQTATKSRSRATVLIHQKSALLAATPPQVTRALAYSHPFIVPLNYLAGLLSWTTGDPWESFLLVAGFWFMILYGDIVLRYAGPLVVVAALIGGMYSRRYSPLSSTAWSGEKKRSRADSDSQQRKSLDEILDTLQIFTNRCDVLLDPLLRLTEFLSTQTTATSATTRPALTSMFLRLLAVMPFWTVLALPPLRIITTQRILLVLGTIGMTWHSRPARATRSVLWRSKVLRSSASMITGLHFPGPATSNRSGPPPLPPRAPAALVRALKDKSNKTGVRFTFATYENQRRWVLLGFTPNLLPNERQAWTDEHNNAVPEKENFPLPETDSDTTKWRWVPGSEWRIDPRWTDDADSKIPRDKDGWTYYDNKWHFGSRIDDWGKWTRRRRWIRDAELVEITPEELAAAADAAAAEAAATETDTQSIANTDSESVTTAMKKKGWFGKRRLTNDKKAETASISGSSETGKTSRSRDGPEDDVHTPLRYRETAWDRSIGDGLAEGLS